MVKDMHFDFTVMGLSSKQFRVITACVLLTLIVIGVQFKMCMQTIEQRRLVQTITLISKEQQKRFPNHHPSSDENITHNNISESKHSPKEQSLDTSRKDTALFGQKQIVNLKVKSHLSTPSSKCPTQRTKIAFLKTHKTAGSTIENMLQRFGYFRNLTFMMPFKELDKYRFNYIGDSGETISPQNVIPKREEDEYEILCNHVVYNENAFNDLLPDDRFLFTIIREPFAQFVSTMDYYGFSSVGYMAKILNQGISNPVSVYLHSPWMYEPKDPFYSMTNNRMSIDLGLPTNQLRNGTFLASYFENMNRKFDLVLLQEHFDESLILFKRKTCWTFKDIIYSPHNTWPYKRKYNMTVDDIVAHRKWNIADYVLYETFYKIFWSKVSKEKDFFEEVFFFKNLQKKVIMFCSEEQTTEILTILDSKWSPGFVLTSEDCRYIRMNEKEFFAKIHKRMMSRAFPKGYTFTQTTVYEDLSNLFNK